MARVKDAGEAQNIVWDYYKENGGPEPRFVSDGTRIRGSVWVVKYYLLTDRSRDELHKAHIDVKTGHIKSI
jgi:hypothetical protein